MDTLTAFLKKASKAQKEKYSKDDFKKWGMLSLHKRTGHMNKEEKSNYFKTIRAGKSPKTDIV